MRKLGKIKLQNAVVLENQEMKMIFGGSGNLVYYCYCNEAPSSGWYHEVEIAHELLDLMRGRCGEGHRCARQ